MERDQVVSRLVVQKPEFVTYLASTYNMDPAARFRSVTSLSDLDYLTLIKLKLITTTKSARRQFNMTTAFDDFAHVAHDQLNPTPGNIFSDEVLVMTRARVQQMLTRLFSARDMQLKTGGQAGLSMILEGLAQLTKPNRQFQRSRRITRSQLEDLTRTLTCFVTIRNRSSRAISDVEGSVRTIVAIVFPKAI
jgi:hypothetical protein